MNISRSAFYSLVKMQNLLNDLRNEKYNLSNVLQREVDSSIEVLASDIQSLMAQYLDEVDANRELAEENDLKVIDWFSNYLEDSV